LVAARAALDATQPVEDWRALPFGPDRGEALMAARTALGACFGCAGRRWWRAVGEAPPGRCMTCHPPPPGLAVTVSDARTSTYQPGDPNPLRDGLLLGWRNHRLATP
jgi:hypothetical protein